MTALVGDLRVAFPSQIAFIDFENALPLDPPTILIDFDQNLEPAIRLGLLCKEIGPRVLAVNPSIDVFADGWTLSEDC